MSEHAAAPAKSANQCCSFAVQSVFGQREVEWPDSRLRSWDRGEQRAATHISASSRPVKSWGSPPEIFVGASAGALVGATYGQDVPLDVLLDGYRLPWRRRHTGPRLHMSAFLGLPGLRDLIDPGYLLSGMFSIDMNSFAVSAGPPVPLAALQVPGTIVYCQWWGRDPGFAAPNNTQLSNGLTYTICP